MHFLRNYVVQAAKRVVADKMEFDAKENAEIVSGRKTFKSAAKSLEKQTLKKQLGSDSKQRGFIPTNPSKQAVSHVETILQKILLNHAK